MNLHNLGHQEGAFRFAVYFIVIDMLLWLVVVQHGFDPWREIPFTVNFFIRALSIAFRYWMYYIALEPLVRKYWPTSLITWHRVLAGRFTDPLVCQDLLLGVFVGLFVSSLSVFSGLRTVMIQPEVIRGGRFLANVLLESHLRSLMAGMSMLAVFLFIRRLIPDSRIATVGAAVMLMLIFGFSDSRPGSWAVTIVFFVTISVLVTRYGIISCMTAIFVYLFVMALPLLPDLTQWYAGNGLFGLVLIGLLAGFAFYLSTLAGNGIYSHQPAVVSR